MKASVAMSKTKQRTILKKLFVFEAVARNMNYTRAAQELGVSQPNVSIQLRQLEEEIGAPLVEQVGKRLSLTKVGESLYPHCRAIRQELNNTQIYIQRLKGIKEGDVTLAIGATAKYFVPTLIAAFQKANPGVLFELQIFGRDELLTSLETNESELIVIGGLPDEPGLVGIPILEDPLVLIAPAGHPLAGEKEITLSRIADEPFLMRNQTSETQSTVDSYLLNNDFEPTVAMVANSNEAIKRGVIAGMGLAFVTRQSIVTEAEAGQIAVLDLSPDLPTRIWHLAHRKNKRFSHVAEAFYDFVREQSETVISQGNGDVGKFAAKMKEHAS